MADPRRATHDPAAAPAAAGGYTQGFSIAGPARLLFVSGQIPVDREGGVPAEFDAQCRLVWHNLGAVLADAGMGLRDRVKVTTFLSDRRFAAANAAVRREVLAGHQPALTVVLAGIYDPRWLLEIEAVAARVEEPS